MDVERRREEASALRDFVHEQWRHLVSLFGEGEESVDLDRVFPVEDAIDEIVEGTDVRVRAVSHYKNNLRSGARKLLEHIDAIVEHLEDPIKISHKSFVYDPQVSSLLGSMNEVKRLCDESDGVQDYIRSSYLTKQDSFFAILSMHYNEKEIFGDELRGEFIHRDVKQTSVFFTSHKLLAPAATLPDVKFSLIHILLEDVVEYLKSVLSQERQREKKENGVHDLKGSMETLNNPLRYLDKLVTILELPLELVTLEEDTVCVNKMGIKISSSDRPCEQIHLQEVEIGGNHNTILVLVEIALKDLG